MLVQVQMIKNPTSFSGKIKLTAYMNRHLTSLEECYLDVI